MAEAIRFERMVEVSLYDELATRWFKPGSPTLPNSLFTFILIGFQFIDSGNL